MGGQASRPGCCACRRRVVLTSRLPALHSVALALPARRGSDTSVTTSSRQNTLCDRAAQQCGATGPCGRWPAWPASDACPAQRGTRSFSGACSSMDTTACMRRCALAHVIGKTCASLAQPNCDGTPSVWPPHAACLLTCTWHHPTSLPRARHFPGTQAGPKVQDGRCPGHRPSQGVPHRRPAAHHQLRRGVPVRGGWPAGAAAHVPCSRRPDPRRRPDPCEPPVMQGDRARRHGRTLPAVGAGGGARGRADHGQGAAGVGGERRDPQAARGGQRRGGGAGHCHSPNTRRDAWRGCPLIASPGPAVHVRGSQPAPGLKWRRGGAPQELLLRISLPRRVHARPQHMRVPSYDRRTPF